MKNRLSVLGLVVFLLCPSLSAWGETFVLRHVYERGASATNEVTINMFGTIQMQKQEEFQHKATISMKMPVEVLEVDKEGNGKLQVKVAELLNDQTLGQESQRLLVTPSHMEADGELIWDRRNKPGPHPLGEFFGAAVYVTLSPMGEVVDFSAKTPYSEMMPNVDIPTQVAHGVVVFPEKPVLIGSSWEVDGNAILTPGGENIISTSRYTLESVSTTEEGRIAEIKVVRTASAENVLIDAKDPRQPTSDLPEVQVVKLRVNKMAQNFEGTILFDIARGRILRTSQKGHHFVDSTGVLSFAGKEMEDNSVSDMNIEIETRMIYED